MKFMKCKGIRKLARYVAMGLLTAAVAMSASDYMVPQGSLVSHAERKGDELYEAVSLAMLELQDYLKQIKEEYSFSEEDMERLEEIYHDGTNYIAKNAPFESFNISSYVGTIETRLSDFAKNYGSYDRPASDTTKYIGLYSNLEVQRVAYGESVMIVLPFVNYSDVDIYNVVVTPQVSADTTKWPFEIDKSGESQMIPFLPKNEVRDTMYDNRVELGWVWTARSEKVKGGYYELDFDVTYERNGATQSAKVSTFVYVSESPDEEEEEKKPENVSTPRIVVTGFETSPSQVFAGDVFTLTLHVQNTSDRTAVSNILFALEAQTGASEGSNSVAGVAPFLPTSGSSTIYQKGIGKGGTADITIEMTARADLSQKPYVLVVNMSYEDEDAKPYTSQTNVSIPIYQEAKYEVSTITADPGYIEVGNSSNLMFNVYNTGKTTLYNVQVKFDQNEVSGGDVFVGKLESGATGKIDTEVIGSAANDGSLTAYLSFEDESGNVTTEEIEIPLQINEMVYEDPYAGIDEPLYEEPQETPQDGMPIWIWIAIGGGVLLVVVAIIVLAAVKASKKKKQEAQLMSDGDDDEVL